MSNRELIDISGVIYRQTEGAVLFSDVGDRDKAVWVPKSQIDYCDSPIEYIPYDKEIDCTITIPEWLAIEKGFV